LIIYLLDQALTTNLQVWRRRLKWLSQTERRDLPPQSITSCWLLCQSL